MFKVLSVFVWTACAVGFGIFLARFEYEGQTPLEHAAKVWDEKVGGGAAKAPKAGAGTPDKSDGKAPKKTHSNYTEAERAAVDKIIATGKR